MKKLLIGLIILCMASFGASAQTEVKKTDKKTKVETPNSVKKVKKTSSPKQKVHNLLHPRSKHYNGVKVKRHRKEM